MDVPKEIQNLAAENIATHALLTALIRQLLKSQSVAPNVIEDAFNDAVEAISIGAIQLGSPEHPTHLPEALRLLEQLRLVIFSGPKPPKHDV